MDTLLSRLYREFSQDPLEDLERQRTLYVDLNDVRGSRGVVTRLAAKIRLADGPTCQVLAGHRGSGKSTELRRLQQSLENPSGTDPGFFVVFCKADDDVDRNDIDLPDVLIAILRQMTAQLKDRLNVSLTLSYLKDRLQRLQELPIDRRALERVRHEGRHSYRWLRADHRPHSRGGRPDRQRHPHARERRALPGADR